MPLGEIARALGHARKSGAGGYVCSCPCHDDKHASLSLNESRDGKPLFRCHAGCDQAKLTDEFKRRGWLNGAGTDRKREPARVMQAAKPQIVAIYPYTDEAGDLLYEVVRYEPKDFKQRRCDERGEWIWSLGDCRRVLFHLPELLEDLAHERTIFIVEGERKVDLLRSWNLAATCNSGGAAKWLPEFSEHFHAGDDVVILPDNDAAGHKHVEAVAASLTAAGASVRVLELPGLAAKGDIVDWAAAGGTPEQFLALADRDARPWAPPEGNGLDHDVADPYEPPGDEVRPPIPDPKIVSLSAWLKREIPPRDHLLGGVMCTTSRWFIHGKTGIGKTLFGMCMGGGTSGRGFLNWTGQRPARVMYLDGELPVETFKERMQLVAACYGEGLPFYGYNRDDLGGVMPPLNTEEGQKWLWRVIESLGPDAVFFDSIMSLLVGSLAEEEPWKPMLPLVRRLSTQRIAQIWFNHENDLGKSFGTKTREWEMDTVGRLSDVEDDEDAIRFDFEKTRLRTPANADQYQSLIIWPGEDWRFQVAAKETKGSKQESTQKTVERALLAAYDRLADGIVKSHGLDGNPVAKVKVDAIRDELKSRGFLPLDDKGNIEAFGRKLFFRAKEELLKAAKLVESEGLIWRP